MEHKTGATDLARDAIRRGIVKSWRPPIQYVGDEVVDAIREELVSEHLISALTVDERREILREAYAKWGEDGVDGE